MWGMSSVSAVAGKHINNSHIMYKQRPKCNYACIGATKIKIKSHIIQCKLYFRHTPAIVIKYNQSINPSPVLSESRAPRAIFGSGFNCKDLRMPVHAGHEPDPDGAANCLCDLPLVNWS